MTARPPPPRGTPGKDAGSAPNAEAPKSPMDRFKDVAKRVVNVSREEFKREEDRYKAANSPRKRNKPGSA